MTTDKKMYLIKLEGESSEKDFHGWFNYTIWSDAKNIWIKAPNGFPKYVREDYRMYAGGEYFKVHKLSFQNNKDFKWIDQHKISYAFFE